MDNASPVAVDPRTPLAGPPVSELEFFGCKAIPMTYEEFDRYQGRLEVWDADTETAWMVREPTSADHEIPSQGLAGLLERIAAVRGSPISCYGSMDLVVRDPRGRPQRIMQADQTVYLRPSRAEFSRAGALLVGRGRFPDVVLEVDHTTDVRRGKLKLYEAWGFPELWVEVPERRAPSRPKSRMPGLAIHLLRDGDSAYRMSPQSAAFPGWRAEDIHEALNEVRRSARTNAVLERLGRSLGAREGTGPDHDSLLRSLRDQSRAQGMAQGLAEGLAEGRAKMARQMLLSRGIEVSDGFPSDTAALAGLSEATIVRAAVACDSEQDFNARLARTRGS
ncbi:MAG: Uma2 family endonuclease [Gammaproteobacteria bacterium]|nr:Uma2 family endonuclease [Gammaproteobacteria bacterium]